jgi:hypothetical protein
VCANQVKRELWLFDFVVEAPKATRAGFGHQNHDFGHQNRQADVQQEMPDFIAILQGSGGAGHLDIRILKPEGM